LPIRARYEDFNGDIIAYARAIDEWNRGNDLGNQNRSGLNNGDSLENGGNSINFALVINNKGVINYDELDRQAERTISGGIGINALSLGEEQGRIRGGRTNVEATLLLRGEAGSDGTQQGNTRERQEVILKEYAQKRGIWISPETVAGWKPISDEVTMEARVYDDGENVIKVGYNYLNFYDTPLEWLTNKISLNNFLFPDTALELTGFTETYGVTKDVQGKFFAPVYQQKYVKGRVLQDNELPLLREEMKQRGFKHKGYSTYYNDNYIINDLHVDNVMITENGNYRLIDTVPRLNTPDQNLDGKREYGDYSIIQEKPTVQNVPPGIISTEGIPGDYENGKEKESGMERPAKPEYEDYGDDVLAFARAIDEWNRGNDLEGMSNSAKFAGQNTEENGTKISERLPQRTVGSENKTVGSMEQPAPNNRASEKATNDVRRAAVKEGNKDEQLKTIEKTAKEKGVWIDNPSSLGDYFSKGGENEVYYNPAENKVYKINNFEYAGDDVSNFFERIDAHNELFPESFYRIAGFTKNSKGEISAVLEQPYVEAEREATEGEIIDYMKSLGFEANGIDDFSNGNYNVFDAVPDNVLMGKDGRLYFIDTQINAESKESDDGGGIRFQAIPGSAAGADVSRHRAELDRRLNLKAKILENWQDAYLPVKEFLDVLRKAGTEVKDYCDFYLQSTHTAGKNDAHWESYSQQYQKPLNKAIHDLTEKGFTLREIENYAILKHRLERNAWMAQKDAAEGKTPKDDYSGLKAVEKETGKSAADFISEFESRAGKGLVEEFWKKVNGATDFSIRKLMESGLISRETYDELKARYRYYIPLRGHDQKTAEDVYDYSPDTGTYFSPPLIKADGRISRSETPFAYIPQMAQSAIVSGNKNTLNMTMKRLAAVDKTGTLRPFIKQYPLPSLNFTASVSVECSLPEAFRDINIGGCTANTMFSYIYDAKTVDFIKSLYFKTLLFSTALILWKKSK
jgi:hypothetical protein